MIQSATDLAVSYADRHAAKALGARWNPTRKVWQAMEGADLAPFIAAGFLNQESDEQVGIQADAAPARYTLRFRTDEPELGYDTITFSTGQSRRMGLVVGRGYNGVPTADGTVNKVGRPLSITFQTLDNPVVLAAAIDNAGALAIVDIDGVAYAFGYRKGKGTIPLQTLAAFMAKATLRRFASDIARYAGPDSRESWNSLIRLIADDVATH